MRSVVFSLAVMAFVTALTPKAALAQADEPKKAASGVVFQDANANGERDHGERGIPGVGVSNGRTVVETDARGRYRLPINGPTTIFVIKPSDWMTPVGEHQLPKFYYNHFPEGSPEGLKYKGLPATGPLPDAINFPLQKQSEPNRFRMILFGDPQPRNQKEVDYMGREVISELIGANAAFGLSLGDNAFNNLKIYPDLNRTIAQIGVPWYNVIGNHDMNKRAEDDERSDDTYTRVFGPPTYAFNYGPVHFIIFDNIVYPGRGNGKYKYGLSKRQLTFIRRDLDRVERDRLVVLASHAGLYDLPEKNRRRLFDALGPRPRVLALAGHNHLFRQTFYDSSDGWNGGEPLHVLSDGTVCGGWWKGIPGERNIPHAMMRDGAPNGYSWVTFNGSDYKIRYKPAAHPADYQMRINAPNAVKRSKLGRTQVVANVFAGNERSKVSMKIDADGSWGPMTRFTGKPPGGQKVHAREKKIAKQLKNPDWRVSSAMIKSDHLWRATLPDNLKSGMHVIHVRTKDMYGHTFTAKQLIHVKE